MTQTTLNFDAPPAQRHSPTSCAAAERIAPITGRMRLKVLAFIRDNGPLTDNEGAARSGMNPSTYRPRRIELMRAGLIEQCGGRDGSTLWKVKESPVRKGENRDG